MAEDAFVTDFEHIMADDITDDVRFIMYDSASGKTASAGEVSKYMMKNVHVDTTLTEEGAAADAKAVGGALAKKADTKGRYEDIVAGGAEQLMADGHETDKDPYLFRTTGGSADVGNREYLDKIVGGTVGWNQLYKRANSGAYNGLTVSLKSDGRTAVINGTTSSVAYIVISDAGISTEYTTKVGHVYLLYKSTTTDGLMVYNDNAGVSLGAVNNYSVSKATGANKFYCRVDKGKTFSNLEVDFRIHDLTAMFGTTIADYIYSLEQSQAGAGVAWFRQYFPKNYYPYDPGTLRSVEGVSAHETVGRNLLADWVFGEYVNNGKIESRDARYHARSPFVPMGDGITLSLFSGGFKGSIAAHTFDSEGKWVRQITVIYTDGLAYPYTATFLPNENDAYIVLSCYAGYNVGGVAPLETSEYQIELGTTATAYEPYTKHTYPLDSSLTLRGVPKLADGKLAFDGDVYPPSGEVQRRYGIVDLGTLTWARNTVGVSYFTSQTNIGIKTQSSASSLANIVCSKYPTVEQSKLDTVDKAVMGLNWGNGICIRDDSYTDSTSFKAAMSGVYLVYELATPTTETADGYEQYQICDPSGTEEYVTTGIVPVGHETRYPHDLKKKIESAPDSPSTDGTYLMKRSGGKNAYMALPSTPSANGSYVLTVTVSGGTASYSWTAKE